MPNALLVIAFVLALWWGLVHVATDASALRVINIIAGLVVALLSAIGLVSVLPLNILG